MSTEILVILAGIAALLVYLIVTHKIDIASLRGRFDSLHTQVGAVHQAALAPVTVVMAPPPNTPPTVAPVEPAPVAATPAPAPVVAEPTPAPKPTVTDLLFGSRPAPTGPVVVAPAGPSFTRDVTKADLSKGEWLGYTFDGSLTYPAQFRGPVFTFSQPARREIVFGYDLGRGISCAIEGYGPVANGDVVDFQASVSYAAVFTATHSGGTSLLLNPA